MGDSSGEDNDSPRGAGGGKKYLAFSPERSKGQSSVKSSNNSVINPTTVEETFAVVSSFIKELGSENECDNALKEAAKLLRGKNLRYGNAPNSEQSTEGDVAFIDQIDSMVNGVSFGGGTVFRNFISGEVNIVGMSNFVSELTDMAKKNTAREQKNNKGKIDVTLEKVQFMLASMMIEKSASSSSSSSPSSSSESSKDFKDLMEEFQYD